jgi:thiamine-phosphate pyrophosphorylase
MSSFILHFAAPLAVSACWIYSWLSASLDLVRVPQVSRLNSSPLDSSFEPDGMPLLCYVTDRRSLASSSGENSTEQLLAKIEAVSAAGVHWIQIREKDLSGRDSAALTREARKRVSRLSSHAQNATRILVNDRLDVALAEQAGGVHLGENSLPAADVKHLVLASQAAQTLPRDFLVGVSCHSLGAAKSAAAAGADYVFFGPVFATPSKAVYGAAQGLDRLAEVCHSVRIPVLAIGGITLANSASCFTAGARGIAAIRLFQDAADPAVVVKAICQQLP